MVEIISKRDGPRREDVQVKRLVEQNRATITRLADQISSGGYSARKAPREAPKAQGLIFHQVTAGSPAAEPDPHVRISLNGRVVIVDQNCGKQLHHIGEIRSKNGLEVFVLATRANGFFSPVNDEIAEALVELDGTTIEASGSEEQLAVAIGARLGFAG